MWHKACALFPQRKVRLSFATPLKGGTIMNDHPALNSLIFALGDDRDGLRQFAIRRLVNIGADAVPALIQALKDPREYAQEGAAIALITLGAVALPQLMQAMKSEDRKLRWGACWVLSSMPPELRQSLPKVALPGSAPEIVPVLKSASESGLHGVWSDAWLSKVRERLEANRMHSALGGLSPA